MQKTDGMPLWVFLVLSSIETRKGALVLIWFCVLFCVYCLPWSLFFGGRAWVEKIFLINGWSWFATMVPITVWYWLSMRWVDRNIGWPAGAKEEKN